MESTENYDDKGSARDDSKEPAALQPVALQLDAPQPANSPRDDNKVLSHCEAMSLVKKSIRELLSDPLLSGLAEDTALEELQDILHLEQGKAITLYLRRYDDSILC